MEGGCKQRRYASCLELGEKELFQSITAVCGVKLMGSMLKNDWWTTESERD